MRALVWFRRDLRIHDNRGLAAAGREADQGVVGAGLIKKVSDHGKDQGITRAKPVRVAHASPPSQRRRSAQTQQRQRGRFGNLPADGPARVVGIVQVHIVSSGIGQHGGQVRIR